MGSRVQARQHYEERGAFQRLHAKAQERANGKVEGLIKQPCLADRKRWRDTQHTDRRGEPRRGGALTLRSPLISSLPSSCPSGAHAGCSTTLASAIGHSWIRWENLQTGKCVYACMSSMYNSGFQCSVAPLANLTCPDTYCRCYKLDDAL